MECEVLCEAHEGSSSSAFPRLAPFRACGFSLALALGEHWPWREDSGWDGPILGLLEWGERREAGVIGEKTRAR